MPPSKSLGIVFDKATPPGGNIPESLPGSSASHTFPAAGDYDYHSSKNRDVKGVSACADLGSGP
jgi:hypothetical protein